MIFTGEDLHVDCSSIGVNSTFDADALASIEDGMDVCKRWSSRASSERSNFGDICRSCNSKGNASSDDDECSEHFRRFELVERRPGRGFVVEESSTEDYRRGLAFFIHFKNS
jgi:hypothetical protein